MREGHSAERELGTAQEGKDLPHGELGGVGTWLGLWGVVQRKGRHFRKERGLAPMTLRAHKQDWTETPLKQRGKAISKGRLVKQYKGEILLNYPPEATKKAT